MEHQSVLTTRFTVEEMHTTILKEVIDFYSNLIESINSIDVGTEIQVTIDVFVTRLLPYLPISVVDSLKSFILLSLEWTPHLLKDALHIVSTIFSPTVIIKQLAFTGVIQTTLLSSHFIRELLDYMKSLIFSKVRLYVIYSICKLVTFHNIVRTTDHDTPSPCSTAKSDKLLWACITPTLTTNGIKALCCMMNYKETTSGEKSIAVISTATTS